MIGLKHNIIQYLKIYDSTNKKRILLNEKIIIDYEIFLKNFFHLLNKINIKNKNEYFNITYYNNLENSIKLKHKKIINDNEKYYFYYEFKFNNKKDYEKFYKLNIKKLFELLENYNEIENEKEKLNNKHIQLYYKKLDLEKEIENNFNLIEMNNEKEINIYEKLYKL